MNSHEGSMKLGLPYFEDALSPATVIRHEQFECNETLTQRHYKLLFFEENKSNDLFKNLKCEIITLFPKN